MSTVRIAGARPLHDAVAGNHTQVIELPLHGAELYDDPAGMRAAMNEGDLDKMPAHRLRRLSQRS